MIHLFSHKWLKYEIKKIINLNGVNIRDEFCLLDIYE